MQVDRFTIQVDTLDLSLTLDNEKYTRELKAPPLLNATDTQYTDIPDDIDEGFGSKNKNEEDIAYFAYSFNLKNTCEEYPTLNYEITMVLENASKELEKAIKVLIIRNGIRTVYAQANEDGSPKPIYNGEHGAEEPEEIIGYTVPFKENKHIIFEPYCLSSNEFDKYTIVIWIDGWESDNSMRSGNFQAELKFSTESYNNIKGDKI